MRLSKQASPETRRLVREHRLVVDWEHPRSGKAMVNAVCITPGCGWRGTIPISDLKN